MAPAVQTAVLVAAAGFAAGLRVNDQPPVELQLGKRITEDEYAARDSGICGKGVTMMKKATFSFARTDCDDLIPHYDMVEWQRQHGREVPDHPCVFTNTQTHEAEVFPTMEAFMRIHGNEKIVALPEYAQSGSHLKDPNALGRINASFKELQRGWDDTFLYFSDFACSEGSLCDKASKQFGSPPLFQSQSFRSKNFLVGGPDSGLPFHKHGMTWQGLAVGRKAWYVMPPGSMSEKLHDETGPFMFPMRSYHGLMVDRDVGQRPLYCVQRPGEVVFVPDSWWHATMNLDEFQVAYGEKPGDKKQQESPSPALAKMLKAYPPTTFDSAGFTMRLAGGTDGLGHPMPYSLQARVLYNQGCKLNSFEFGEEHSFDEPLRRMQALTGTRVMACGAAETIAFAHCHLAQAALGSANNCKYDEVKKARVTNSARKWFQAAYKISPSLVNRETNICHKPW